MLIVALMFGSATLVATTATLVTSITTGAVNKPVLEIVPAFVLQVTPEFVLSVVTDATNWIFSLEVKTVRLEFNASGGIVP